jgi:hypothetical protein
MTTKDLMAGNFAGAGIKTRQEAMTGDQLQVRHGLSMWDCSRCSLLCPCALGNSQTMSQIQQQTVEQDQLLEEISKGLDDLKDLADKMNDEVRARARKAACDTWANDFVLYAPFPRKSPQLQLQEKIMDDLDSKTDRVQVSAASAV